VLLAESANPNGGAERESARVVQILAAAKMFTVFVSVNDVKSNKGIHVLSCFETASEAIANFQRVRTVEVHAW
jgi:lysophospholipase L1-like esterase